MDECGASEDWRVVFDKDLGKPCDKRLSWKTVERDGKAMRVVGC
jgi:hypothetical protein